VLKNMKIGAKLTYLAGFTALIMMVIGALGLRGMGLSNDHVEAIY